MIQQGTKFGKLTVIGNTITIVFAIVELIALFVLMP